uniref:Tify domain-containing protein n=1 Tax=Tanacetum cinerariifolium TaxID=118510 RepID=A0A6L2N6L8_TANCI|nr:hypothetical protein [Tanacetum cinerariifolium]
MRRNCNLTLRLVPPCLDDHHQREESPIDESMHRNQNQNVNENQKLTIFYDGMVSVCHVTELQARAIIKVASGEIDEKWASRTPCSQASSPLIVSPSPSPSTGALSMKRSLQRMTQLLPMKGMLSGPVTILNWYSVRNDQPRFETCYQNPLAIKDEVEDIEKAEH